MENKNNTFDNTVESLFKGMESFITSKTVVGDAITVGDTIILPLIDVSFGVGAGAANAEKKNNGGGGIVKYAGGGGGAHSLLDAGQRGLHGIIHPVLVFGVRHCHESLDLRELFVHAGKHVGQEELVERAHLLLVEDEPSL